MPVWPRARLADLAEPILVVAIGDSGIDGALSYGDLLAEGDPDYAWAGPEDEWQSLCLLYTSGTTGDPKGAVYSHRGGYLQALGQRRDLRPDRRERVSLDAADVPLQRLVLPLGERRGLRRARFASARSSRRRSSG